jgi:hypothetical protein
MKNKIIGYAVIDASGDLRKYDTIEEAEAFGVPIAIVELPEIIRYEAH